MTLQIADKLRDAAEAHLIPGHRRVTRQGADLLEEAYRALDRIAANAHSLATDDEQTASSRRWWGICEEDARSTLSRLRGEA